MTPEDICRALAEPARLQVFAAVALGAVTTRAIAERTGLPKRAVLEAIATLERRGLIQLVDGTPQADLGVFKESVRTLTPPPDPTPLDPDAGRDAVLRSYLDGGRLIRIPSSHRKRLVVLEHLVADFEPGIRYAEKQVNEMLMRWYDDYASLRRYLVDEALLSRDHGIYWRTGGPPWDG